jgi:ribonuclease D
VAEQDLPSAANRADGPPPPRAWAQRDPVAAARLDRARTSLQARADQLNLPVENLLAPDLVRRLMWQPPSGALDGSDPEAVAQFLLANGARPWQVQLTANLLGDAMRPTAS